MNMKITIKNRRTYKGPGEWIARGKSPLGNPFYLKNVNDDHERCSVIRKYKVWLWGHIENGTKDIMAELDRLYGIAMTGEELVLICFCAPKQCHGDVIRQYLIWKERNFVGQKEK
jgi:hypothetical protein